MNQDIRYLFDQIIEQYDLPMSLKDYQHFVNGHINETYKVTLIDQQQIEHDYFFQRINDYVFKEPAKVMHNIKVINQHLKQRQSAGQCDIISFLNSKGGDNYTRINDQFWRVCPAVTNAVTYDFVENSRVLHSAGYAFGRFQSVLADLPMDQLYETIPDFHNTRKRMDDFFTVVTADVLGRAGEVRDEIEFFKKHRQLACTLSDMTERGELPLRVTHNDTKYNNILMDKDTYQPLCVIDLDTVMPGLSMVDFGDAIRFAANTAVEDEVDLGKVGLNLGHYREFTRGFMLAAQHSLNQNEIDHMALGAIVITIELASRFLADHINGDKYFRIHRPDHNLQRARCQIRLAADMLDHYDEMCRIVKETITV